MALAAVLLTACSTAPERAQIHAAPSSEPVAVQAYGKLPMRFEENRGQIDHEVRYLANGPGYTVFLTEQEAVLRLKDEESSRALPRAPHATALISEPAPATGVQSETAVLRISLAGAEDAPSLSAEGLQTGRSNYFRGSDPDRWTTNVPGYDRVRYQAVYPGIDLVWYGNPHQLEYDFVVAPGADPGVIRLVYRGADGGRIDEDGDLVLKLGRREVVQRRPVVYQDIDGERRRIVGDYLLQSGADAGDPIELAFQLDAYDPAHALVIDPVLAYSTYVSGSDFDDIRGLAVDGSGHLFITGMTLSSDFPVVGGLAPGQGGQPNPGTFDVIVAKLNPAGDGLVYSTYLAGNGMEIGFDLAIDASGAVYVTGYTDSTNFPVVGGLSPAQAGTPDGSGSPFVAKLNSAGDALVYSTYLAAGNGHDEGHGLAVDGAGNAYVTGLTSSPFLFPVVGGLPPDQGGLPSGDGTIFIAKLNPAGSDLVYSTYLSGSGFEWAMDIAVDEFGQAYVGGMTDSLNMPRVGGLPDEQGGAPRGGSKGYFAKLNADGDALIYSTYLAALSSKGLVLGDVLTVDAAGHLYVAGRTSDDFPVVGGLPPEQGGQRSDQCCVDVFVAKLSPAGDALVYSTYLGGNYIDGAYGIAVDDAGQVHVAGQTNSTNFPQLSGLPPDQGGTPFVDDGSWGPFGPPNCVFASTLNPAGDALVSSTYLCGNSSGWDLALGDDGDIYVAGNVGNHPGIPFPIVGGLPPDQGGAPLGGAEAFVAKLTANAPLLSIERARFDVEQTAESVEVDVVRSGSLEGSAMVDFTTIDGTAVGGVHYVPTAGTLLWPPGDDQPRTISIIIDNAVASGIDSSIATGDDPYFRLQLAAASGAVLGTPDVATITIRTVDLIFADGFE